MHAGAGYDTTPLISDDNEDGGLIESRALATTDPGLRQRRTSQHARQQLLASSNDRDKEILHMRFFEDLTQAEIADSHRRLADAGLADPSRRAQIRARAARSWRNFMSGFVISQGRVNVKWLQQPDRFLALPEIGSQSGSDEQRSQLLPQSQRTARRHASGRFAMPERVRFVALVQWGNRYRYGGHQSRCPSTGSRGSLADDE